MTSIIIPLYNQQEFVAQAVESALGQVYRDFEVIVVNDGSTDDSLAIVSSLDSIRLMVINQANGGLSAARNAGIAASRGEFILPLDADDYIDPEYLAKTVPLMSDPRVGIVSTDMQYFGLRDNRIPPRGLTLDVEKHGNELPVCSLIRKTALLDAGGYETLVVMSPTGKKVYGFEDWELWIDILKHGWKVAVVNEPLFHYRLKPVSMVTEASSMREELTREIRRRHPDVYGGRA